LKVIEFTFLVERPKTWPVAVSGVGYNPGSIATHDTWRNEQNVRTWSRRLQVEERYREKRR
jgi:hypothetical protein